MWWQRGEDVWTQLRRSELTLLGVLSPLVATRQRREVLTALTVAYMLVQLSSLPVALSLPTIAEHFEVGIDDATWIVIVYLMVLGSLVLLAARLGDLYGHVRMFFLGIVVATLGAGLLTVAGELWHLVIIRGVAGVGSAMIMGNANAILAVTFPPSERGRAFAIPTIGARIGTLMGLVVFGAFLHFIGWRPVFGIFVPLGVLAMVVSVPILRHPLPSDLAAEGRSIDWTGAVLLVVTVGMFMLAGAHLHGGEESFVSSDGLLYHVPMYLLTVLMLGVFVLVERRISSPIVDMQHLRNPAFTFSLGTNVTFHASMLGTMTLVPILVEEGFGMSPIWVIVALLPSQALGLFMPLIAGWIYDRYHPKFLRLWLLLLIAAGFFVLSLSGRGLSFWTLPLLMLPISIGSNMFNPVNNATIMNSLPLEHRGMASGMLETTRELGHALGATAAAAVLTLALPTGIGLVSQASAQAYFSEGFRLATLAVVGVLLFGAVLAYFQQMQFRGAYHKTTVRVED